MPLTHQGKPKGNEKVLVIWVSGITHKPSPKKVKGQGDNDNKVQDASTLMNFFLLFLLLFSGYLFNLKAPLQAYIFR